MENKKVVIVTGASRGIGREIAKLLSKDNIVVANYNKSKEQAESLKEESNNIDIFKADVTKREEVQALVKYTLDKYGKIDVLVNNAGIDQRKMFQDINDEDFEKIIRTNLYSVYCMTQEVMPNMISNRKGLIINMSSIDGIVGASCYPMYSATKGAIDSLTKSLAKELGPCNIRVNSIAPGFIDTQMNAFLTEEEREELKYETPLQRIGTGLDIARCIKWLLDDEFTTGQVISLNGGLVIY